MAQYNSCFEGANRCVDCPVAILDPRYRDTAAMAVKIAIDDPTNHDIGRAKPDRIEKIAQENVARLGAQNRISTSVVAEALTLVANGECHQEMTMHPKRYQSD